MVNNKYTVDATYYEIFEHYDKCLRENGWELIQEDRIHDWGRDMEEKLLNIEKPLLKMKYLLLPFIKPVLAAGVVVIIAYCSGYFTVKSVDYREIDSAMIHEYDMIKVMPNATATSERSFRGKENHALIGNNFNVDATYLEIFEHYDSCLKDNGWVFIREDKIYDWFNDYGGKTVKYKKGDYIATIQYAGETANYKWTYGFSMSWGLYRELE